MADLPVQLRSVAQADLKEVFELIMAVRRETYAPYIPHEFYDDFMAATAASENNYGAWKMNMEARLGDDAYRCICAEHAGTLVGYVAARAQGSVLFVKNLYVNGNYRGLGIGSRLLDAVTDAAGVDTAGLEVLAENARAIAVYKGRGFKIDGPAASDYFGAKKVRMTKGRLPDY